LEKRNVYRSEFPDSAYIRLNQRTIPHTINSFSDSYDQSASITQNLNAEIDKTGVVNLSWSANNEADFMGYRLVAAGNSEGRFIPVASEFFELNSYKDTLALNFINREYFYKIAAIDQNFNISDFSAPVQIFRPDTISPVQPILEKPTLENGRVILNWTLGSDTDLEKIELLRKTPVEENWQVLAEVVVTDITSYADTPNDGNFQYAVRAIDESGNQSRISNIRFLEISKKEQSSQISNFKFELLADNQVKLLWDFPKTLDQYSFMIFRKTPSQNEPELIDSVPFNSITDRSLKAGENYEYFIVGKSSGGQFTSPSEILTVSY